MEVLENREQWQARFREGWLVPWEQTGTFNWKGYPRPSNSTAPAGRGIDLSRSRLLLISTAGGYLPGRQAPFDAAHPLGDYSIRLFPSSTPLDDLAYSHHHYDRAAVNEDAQVLLPLRHLAELVAQGTVGELAPSVISFMGYQPDVTRVLDEMIAPILEVARDDQVDAALLVPA